MKKNSKRYSLVTAISWLVLGLIWVILFALRLVFSDMIDSVLLLILPIAGAAVSFVYMGKWFFRYSKAQAEDGTEDNR